MCHHHGVGKYRVRWIKQEHGSAYPVLKKLKEALDPNNIMNPGTIFPLRIIKEKRKAMKYILAIDGGSKAPS